MTKHALVDDHPSMVRAIGLRFPHSIRVLRSDAPINMYTCVMYALDMANDDEYIRLTMATPSDLFASPHFLDWLISTGRLRRIHASKAGALVVYRNRGQTKHIGVVASNNRVRSKWGLGLLYEHEVLEVPDSYGSTLWYLERLTRNEAICHYKKYLLDGE